MSTITKTGRNNQAGKADSAQHRRRASRSFGTQAKKITEDLQELGGIAGDAGREKVHQVKHTCEQFIQEQPLKSILIAAGVGLVLGRFWMRR